MAKVLTFSRTFPSYHNKKGEETDFVTKIWNGLVLLEEDIEGIMAEKFIYRDKSLNPKYHTIRSGNRWKVGDKFSPRVWSGKPYASKQITIAPDIEVKKVWSVTIELIKVPMKNTNYATASYKFLVNGVVVENAQTLALNDGLTYTDLRDWFKILKSLDKNRFKRKLFEGQIICWNENINY